MVEHPHPTPSTQKHVLSASGNVCAFPGCSRLIFDLHHETLIGTIAHICARSENGRRFDPNQSEAENRSFGNLIALCAEHSKIVDGPKWSDFSVSTLKTWKRELELRVARDSDRGWIRPPSQIVTLRGDGEPLRLSYWIDRQGAPRVFSAHQLSVLNALMALNMLLLQLGALPDRLQNAKANDVSTVLQQSWAQFPTNQSVIADLVNLMAMTAEVNFAEFLGFVVAGNDPTTLIQEGASRIKKMNLGEADSVVKAWFRSDLLS
jgi:hypothetical protein